MKKDNKQEIAYKVIRSRILEGFYVQGQRLVIDTLGKELSLSPIPIREAIRRLEAEGLVNVKAYSGAVVSFIDENEYFEVLSTLSVLEGYAVSIGSNFVSNDQIKKLQEINIQIKEALENFNFNEYIKLNKEFHLQSINNCPNKSLYSLIEQTWEKLDTIRRLKPMYFPTRAIEAISEHNTIISLLKTKKSSQEIELFVRQHHVAAIKDFTKQPNNSF
ncbi:GntR family transcriptional regulator [Bacillus salipaludis]|uniref:GntR family transcriptional regulator n=1 Tax=Bacillus salipaludis TaxID=2547811 RepID=A0A4R5VMV3_9BACI|nr:GntR family transcriptional regulator [Bacillus salipaludis]MDQ6599088.1 GntR family transcriptional regulator [Bacillus salipaludis]TDK58740.1 GntR family transcriptional regulator [Bacillus salipaludis]